MINSFLHLSLNITHYALKTNIGFDTTSFIYEWHMLIWKKSYFKYLAFHVTLSVQFVKQLKGVSFPIGLQVVACTKVSEGIVGYIFCCPEYMYIHLACTWNFVRVTCTMMSTRRIFNIRADLFASIIVNQLDIFTRLIHILKMCIDFD